MDGVIIVDKPPGWTSHDVVGKMRRLAKTKAVGHLGTLDPMATGVLPLVLNRATRLSQFYLKAVKTYEGIIVLGQATSTYDAEGDPVGDPQPCAMRLDEIEQLATRFRGEIEQMPPAVSAKKIGGVPAYKLARKNQVVKLEPVRVVVHKLELLGLEGNRLAIHVECSAGTYVRSIAHDLGAAIGCGAHLGALRRLRSGDFDIGQARTIDELALLSAEDRLAEALVPASQLLPQFPSERVDSETARQIRNGRNFNTSPFGIPRDAKYVKAVDSAGEIIAIGEAVLPNVYHPMLVL